MLKVIKFSVTWCGPCKAFGISSVPTVIVMKNGSEVHRFSGVKPKNVINSIINQYK